MVRTVEWWRGVVLYDSESRVCVFSAGPKGEGSDAVRVRVRLGERKYAASRVLAYALCNPDRLSWAQMEALEVHHGNEDTLDNTVANLEILSLQDHRDAHKRRAPKKRRTT